MPSQQVDTHTTVSERQSRGHGGKTGNLRGRTPAKGRLGVTRRTNIVFDQPVLDVDETGECYDDTAMEKFLASQNEELSKLEGILGYCRDVLTKYDANRPTSSGDSPKADKLRNMITLLEQRRSHMQLVRGQLRDAVEARASAARQAATRAKLTYGGPNSPNILVETSEGHYDLLSLDSFMSSNLVKDTHLQEQLKAFADLHWVQGIHPRTFKQLHRHVCRALQTPEAVVEKQVQPRSPQSEPPATRPHSAPPQQTLSYRGPQSSSESMGSEPIMDGPDMAAARRHPIGEESPRDDSHDQRPSDPAAAAFAPFMDFVHREGAVTPVDSATQEQVRRSVTTPGTGKLHRMARVPPCVMISLKDFWYLPRAPTTPSTTFRHDSAFSSPVDGSSMPATPDHPKTRGAAQHSTPQSQLRHVSPLIPEGSPGSSSHHASTARHADPSGFDAPAGSAPPARDRKQSFRNMRAKARDRGSANARHRAAENEEEEDERDTVSKSSKKKKKKKAKVSDAAALEAIKAKVKKERRLGRAPKSKYRVGVLTRKDLAQLKLGRKWMKKRKREIKKNNARVERTMDMMIGIRTMVHKHREHSPTEEETKMGSKEFTQGDFDAVVKLSFPSEGGKETPAHPNKQFQFKDYAGAVFAELRAMSGIDEDDYLHSVAGDLPFLDFISNSNSGQFFFYTFDKKYMIKSQPKEENKFFRSILPEYFQHMKDNPDSLLSRIYGLHRVSVEGRDIYFMIMGNVFNTEKHIHKRFDLKGSWKGRAATEREKEQLTPVLKDQDFADTYIHLGPRRDAFLRQLEADVKFLDKAKIMDYSLLVGIHDKTKSPQPRRRRRRPSSSTPVSDSGSASSTPRVYGLADSQEPAYSTKQASEEVRSYFARLEAADAYGRRRSEVNPRHLERLRSSGLLAGAASKRDELTRRLPALAEEGDRERESRTHGRVRSGPLIRRASTGSLEGLDKDQRDRLQSLVTTAVLRTAVAEDAEIESKELEVKSVDGRGATPTTPRSSAFAGAKAATSASRNVVRHDSVPPAGQPWQSASITVSQAEDNAPAIEVGAHRSSDQEEHDGARTPSRCSVSEAESSEAWDDTFITSMPARTITKRTAALFSEVKQSRQTRCGMYSGGVEASLADGTPGNEIYYFGIIDILQVYNVKKKGEYAWKAIFFGSKKISAVPPKKYSKRFVEFISEHVD